MPDQIPLFGFKDTRPKLKAKKIVPPERIAEIKKILASGDQVAAMRMFGEVLDKFDKRLHNQQGK